MKTLLIFLFFSSSVFAKTQWTAGDERFQLEKVKDQGFVSSSCLKECALKKAARENLAKLDEVDVDGGKDPASGYCKLLDGNVIYLSQAEDVEAFCVKGKDVISLSLLIPDK